LKSLRFVLVGPGALGLSLSWALRRAGHRCVGVQGRGARAAARARTRLRAGTISPGAQNRFDLLLLAVPDDAIGAAAREWARSAGPWKGRFAIHVSGVLSSEILGPLRRRGARCGSLHPLTSLPRPSFTRDIFHRVTFAVEGDPAARALGGRLARQVGGKVLRVPGNSKAAYHLAACLSSGYLLAYLALVAERLEGAAKLRSRSSLDGLLHLAAASVHNARIAGLPQSLTGPIMRGDTGTLRLHEEILRKMPAIYRAIHRKLAMKQMDLAQRSGKLRGESARRVRRHFSLSRSERE
jgi:predicted short-subunit dehydrogenase-like oxidoreductase (DUF2520 family)